MTDIPIKQKRGFAAMSPEKRKEISSRGGHAAQKKGTAHRWNVQEASLAGVKGGQASAERKTLLRQAAKDSFV